MATYSGNEYIAQIYKDGELAERGNIVLSQHQRVTGLRDDYFALLEGVSRRTGAAVIDKSRAPEEMHYICGQSQSWLREVLSLMIALIFICDYLSIERGTGLIFLPAPPETLKPEELEQVAISRY